jgi:integrase
MLGLTEVKLPHIRREETLPFVPLEEELDAVISSVRTKMATFLRVLKDTGARPLEAWTLKWTDISITSKCVTITPAKYSHARKLSITEQTLNMLLALPTKSQYVFSSSGQRDRFADELEHFAINFVKARTRIANKLQNPRIKLISLRTFRHWKATMLYHRKTEVWTEVEELTVEPPPRK